MVLNRNRIYESSLWFGTLCSLCLSGSITSAQSLAVFPPVISLETARDRQSFVVQLTRPDGITQDVSADAAASFANPAVVRRDGFFLYPLTDGQTEMTVTHSGQTVKVPVTVVRRKRRRRSVSSWT